MRFISDLHLEFEQKAIKRGFPPFEFPVAMDTDADTVLVLAGDIAVAIRPAQYVDFINKAAERFKHVVWVMGNHEHYGGSINRSIAKIKRNLCITKAMEESGALNISVVENEVVSVDDVDFVCATLWTDYAGHNPLVMMDADGPNGMRDFDTIRCGRGDGQLAYASRITPEYIYQIHTVSRKFIEREVPVSKEAGKKVVVVTHHAPSYQSLDEHFRGKPTNPCYATPLEIMIEDLEPGYWIHGHVHCTNDYNIGKTNVLSNPRGYNGHASPHFNEEFDTTWTIDLS
jgi:Icc-related predicted phosphoesterase